MSDGRDRRLVAGGRRGGFGSVAVIPLPGGGVVPADAAREVWASALCAQVDPELFFPEKGQPAAPAKAVCARVPGDGAVPGDVRAAGRRRRRWRADGAGTPAARRADAAARASRRLRPDPSCPPSGRWSGSGAAGQDRPGREEGTAMIDKMVGGAVNALTGAIKVVVLFGVLVGLVVWAQARPGVLEGRHGADRRGRRRAGVVGRRPDRVPAEPGRLTGARRCRPPLLGGRPC